MINRIPLTLVFFFILLTTNSFSQVGIGTINPSQSAILDVESTAKGFLPPRLNRLQRNKISAPAEALMVYCIDCCDDGRLSFYDGTVWLNVPSCIPQGTVAGIPKDSDYDGVPDHIDIDDDNDGILDRLESSLTRESLRNTSNINFDDNFNNFTRVTGSVSDFSYPSASGNGVIDYKNLRGFRTNENGSAYIQLFNVSNSQGHIAEVDITLENPELTTLPNSIVTSNSLVLDDIDGDPTIIEIKVSTKNGLITDLSKIEYSTSSDGTLVVTDMGNGIFKFVVTKTNLGGQGPNVTITIPGELITNYNLRFLESNFGGDNIYLPITREIYTYTDSDGDNVPNQFDLNSDDNSGDICSDAYEAGMTTNSQANFNFSHLEVGANGLADVLEDEDTQQGVTISPPDLIKPYDGSCL